MSQQPSEIHQETDGWMLLESPNVGRLLEEVAGSDLRLERDGDQGEIVNMVGLNTTCLLFISI